MNFKRLSLCMIVKDEDEYIGKCLNSIKEVVDEIIIVDTGSTDRTVEICQSFGAKVYHFPWNGSFSDARNYGLERATGDWILWLDADEEVDPLYVYRLRDILYFSDNILSIHLINYYGDSTDPDKTFEIAHTRLFQNHKGLKFINKIHEALNAAEVLESTDGPIKTVPIKIHHYGYLDSVKKKKKKFERNISMLKEELLKEDASPWIHYHIASEYFNIKKYKEAFEAVNRSIMGFLQELRTPPSLVYRLKYLILLSSGNIEGAWPGIERAIALYPDYVDLHFYKGLILFAKQSYDEALEVFDHCIDLGESNLQHLTLKGVGSFRAIYYKGCCLEKLGRIEEATLCYAQAVDLASSFIPPQEALNRLVENQKSFKQVDPKNDL